MLNDNSLLISKFSRGREHGCPCDLNENSYKIDQQLSVSSVRLPLGSAVIFIDMLNTDWTAELMNKPHNSNQICKGETNPVPKNPTVKFGECGILS